MALMMKVRIEENKKEVNIVIWNEVDDDQIKSVVNPIVNLKIPLKTLNNEVVIKENTRHGFAEENTSLKNNDEVDSRASSDPNNKENCLDERLEDNFMDCSTVTSNETDVQEMIESVVNTVEENLMDGCSTEKSLIDTVLDYEEDGEDLSFASYLEYIKKKSEAFEKIEYEIRVSKNINKTKQGNDFPQRHRNQTEEYESSPRFATPPTVIKKATDTMSVASDDYTLMIEDESSEKDLSRRRSEQSSSKTKNELFPVSSFRCQSCEKVFAKKASRRQHMIAVHDLKFSCPICGTMFSLRRQLLMHLRIHGSRNTSGTRASPFPCSQCNRKYKCAKALKEHSKTHLPIQSRFFWRVSKMNVSLPAKPKMNAVTLGVPVCKSV